MSRFFAASSSSEDEDEFVGNQGRGGNRFGTFYDSEEEEETSQDGFSDEESEGVDVDEEAGSDVEEGEGEEVKRNRFLFGSDSEDESDEDGQRQVKSAKEKAQEEFDGVSQAINDAIDDGDWSSVQAEYERLLKLMNKQSRFITAAVFETIRMIESVASETSAEEKKKMSGADAKAFNAVRQKNKKTLSQYEGQMQQAQSLSSILAAQGEAKWAEEAAAAPKVIEMTPENVLRKLQEIIGSRGRKHIDKQENLLTLRKLYELAGNSHHRAQVVVGALAVEFDMAVGLGLGGSAAAQGLGYLALETWLEAVADTDRLVGLLGELGQAQAGREAEAEELGLPGFASLQGSLLSFAQRLDDEFSRALQILEPHTAEYEEFLRAEGQLVAVLGRACGYFAGQAEAESHLLLRQLEHIYFRPNSSAVAAGLSTGPRQVAEICSRLYASASERIRVRALLCHVYQLALHGHYGRARDLLLASRIPDGLASLEIASQILYNRTVVQLGLAAFQRGALKEAYFALQEVCASGRPRELLAQGSATGAPSALTPEQERAERQRQLPSHMHISIELIDSVFLTVSMLLEIPQAAAAARRFFRGERKLFPSRHLRRLMDAHDRLLFNGPPENTRDHIIAAAKLLANGDWKRCLELILQSRLWELFPAPALLAAMLQRKVREAAISSWIFTFGPTYTSLNLEVLAARFDLPLPSTRAIIERIIQEHGLPASVDIAMLIWSREGEVSPMQELVLQLKDKLAVLSERNMECADVLSRQEFASHF